MGWAKFWEDNCLDSPLFEDAAQAVWDAAIEAAANSAEDQDCDQTEYMCMTIERAAKAIRALRSNQSS